MEAVGERSVSWDGHLVLIHDDERQRRAGVTAWARRGLDLGAKILYIEPPDEPGERSFLRVLTEGGVDAGDAVERGQLQVFHADDDRVYDPTWQDGAIDEALADGYPTVRWSAEARTAWSQMSLEAHADLEWSTDGLCQERPVSVLCQYPSDLLQDALRTVCAMHTGGLREALVQTTPIPGGVAVAGEVDSSNARTVHSALAAASAARTDGGDMFVVSLAGLDFLDVAGSRALLGGTAAHRGRGGVTYLVEAQPAVDRLLRLLGVEHVSGVSLEAPR